MQVRGTGRPRYGGGRKANTMAFDTAARHTGRADSDRRPRVWRMTVLGLLLALVTLSATRLLATGVASPPKAVAESGEGDTVGLASTAVSAQPAGQQRCEFFVVQKILSARDPAVIDHWETDGKRVFEVGFEMPGENGSRVRLCVYDPEDRSALLPASGDEARWRPGGAAAAPQ